MTNWIVDLREGVTEDEQIHRLECIRANSVALYAKNVDGARTIVQVFFPADARRLTP